MQLKIRIPKLTAEHFFQIFLALYWGKDIIFSYLKAVILRIPYIKYVADYIIPFLMLVCLLFAFLYFVQSISWKDVVFTGVVVVVYFLNLLIYPENKDLSAIAVEFFVLVFPLYFVGLRLEPSKHFRLLYIMSIVNIWAFAAYYLVFGDSSFDTSSMINASFMGRAYTLLPQVLIVLVVMLKKKNILNIVTGVIGFVLLLMCGNRGSVLLLFIFLAIYFLFNTKKEKRALVSIGTFSFVYIVACYYEILMANIIIVFRRFGLSVRIFERLSDGSFFESHGRDSIIEKLTSAIWNNPIIGHGLCSDRTIAGSYAHNYAFELWTAFGVILGSVILIATVFIIIGAWMKSTDKNNRSFLLTLICTGFLKLFISSSFLLEGLFFMLMGYCITQIRINKLGIVVLGED